MSAHKFTNTDTGMVRKLLVAAGMGLNIVCGLTIYNDLNRVTNKRRLKVARTWYQDTVPGAVQRKMLPLLKKTFGARFVKAEIVNSNEYCVYLDDNKGAPFKPTPSLRKPQPAAYKRPERLTRAEHEAFWQQAVVKPNARPSYTLNGSNHVLKHDVCGFKKIRSGPNGTHTIVNLIIPAGARVYVTDGKCRASEAKVESMVTQHGQRAVSEGYSMWDNSYKYRVGQVQKPKYAYDRQGGQCTSGIHFFLDINDALAWCW
jgi:hypothetical protein